MALQSSQRPQILLRTLRAASTVKLLVRKYSTTTSSVNPTEVGHFNALASSWWDPHGPSRLLHLMNPLRHEFISGCLKSQQDPAPHSGLRYLDVGCGGGIFAESAARMAQVSSVTGIDPSCNVLDVARMHAKQDPFLQEESRLKYINTSIEDLPVPDVPIHRYDVLSLFEVIEHISDPSSFLTSCLPFVKPGGWIVISTIARTWTSWLTTKIVAEDLARIVPRGTHDWQKYINEEELRAWFAKKGMTSARSMGVIYIPGLGWREVRGSEQWGNYFFGIRKTSD